MTENRNNLKINWKFCPDCGNDLPNVEDLKYCIKCGCDLVHIEGHEILTNRQTGTPYEQTQGYPPYAATTHVSYKQRRELISDESILNIKDKKLWGILPSMGFPIIAVVIMNAILIIINLVAGEITNPFFDVALYPMELILVIFPLWYVRKYLQNRNLKNRLTLLGFTAKGYDYKGILQEILIGLIFAVVGILIAIGVSILMRFIFQFFFGIRFTAVSNGVDYDVYFLILLILMMLIFVGPPEEILFRGFMQRGLTRKIGKILGILVAAVIFASIHFTSYIYYIFIYDPILIGLSFLYNIFPYICIGILLGLEFQLRRENLIAVIITHCVYNSLILIFEYSLFSFV